MWNTKHKNLFDLKKNDQKQKAHIMLKEQCMTMLNSAIEGTQTRTINFLTNPWVHVQTSTYSHKIKNSLALITHTI